MKVIDNLLTNVKQEKPDLIKIVAQLEFDKFLRIHFPKFPKEAPSIKEIWSTLRYMLMQSRDKQAITVLKKLEKGQPLSENEVELFKKTLFAFNDFKSTSTTTK
jgi:hypothetical protein